MSDVLALGSLVVSALALGVAYRSDRRAAASQALVAEEHRQRQADRAARPVLRVEVAPSNVPVSSEGVIVTEATTQYVNLAIRVAGEYVGREYGRGLVAKLAMLIPLART